MAFYTSTAGRWSSGIKRCSSGACLRKVICNDANAGRTQIPRTSIPLTRSHSTTEGNGVNNQPQTYDDRRKQLLSSSTLSLAPMMEYTDRHFRHLVRLVSHRTLLYTEMVTANAIVHERSTSIERASTPSPSPPHPHSPTVTTQSLTDLQTFGYDMSHLRRYIGQTTAPRPEGPSVLQLGGSDPSQLSTAVATVSELTQRGYCDYTAINLNCGCPSPKVAGRGRFGAALMEDPVLVRDLVVGMDRGGGGRVPITVKCRIGTDAGYGDDGGGGEEGEYARLREFVETVASSGVVTDFQVHARIAVLGRKFSPADNRKIPALKYNLVGRLVEDYPELTFSLNGGVETVGEVRERLEECPGLKGVMVGRAWAADPWSFSNVDQVLYGEDSARIGMPKNRLEVLQEYGRHADAEEELWDPTRIRRFIIKAVQPLFAGEANAKRYRIALDEIAGRPKRRAAEGKTMEGEPPLSESIVNAALEHLSEEALMRTPEESYALAQERAAKSSAVTASRNIGGGCGGGSQIVKDWQTARKEEDLTKGKVNVL